MPKSHLGLFSSIQDQHVEPVTNVERRPTSLRGQRITPCLNSLFTEDLTFFKCNDAVIEADTVGLTGNEVRFNRAAAVVCIQTVDQSFGKIDERTWVRCATPVLLPVRCVQILHHIHRVLRHTRIEEVEGSHNVRHLVTAVVEHYVRYTEFIDHGAQESFIALVADTDKYAWRLVRPAAWVDVDADNSGERPEIALPHPQRPTLEDTNFEKRKGLVTEPAEMPLV